MLFYTLGAEEHINMKDEIVAKAQKQTKSRVSKCVKNELCTWKCSRM